ncbi:MAG: hypothetical protein ABI026_09945 [Gemmatimonadaceae bacterium]
MSPAHSMSVDPLVPLSLLEALREADRLDGAGEAEYAPEYVNKRLGTADTVYAQIRRYNEAARRGHPIQEEEVIALARLIGRRPDATELFRNAGRATARTAYGRISSIKRGSVNYLPRIVARPIARRQAQKLLARYFGAVLNRTGAMLKMDIPTHAPVSAGATEPGREYYDAALNEILTLLTLI